MAAKSKTRVRRGFRRLPRPQGARNTSSGAAAPLKGKAYALGPKGRESGGQETWRRSADGPCARTCDAGGRHTRSARRDEKAAEKKHGEEARTGLAPGRAMQGEGGDEVDHQAKSHLTATSKAAALHRGERPSPTGLFHPLNKGVR